MRRIAAVLGRSPAEVRSWFAATPLTTEKLADARGLRAVRAEAGLSRRQLASVAGVSQATVAHWECGRRGLPAARWNDVAAALGMTVVEFERAVRSGRCLPPRRPLRDLRRARGLTQRQVAAALGVSGALVSQWERGIGLPGWPHLRRLALLFVVPLADVAVAGGRDGGAILVRSRSRPRLLGPVLREARLWRGEPRVAVARRIGIHTETLRRWEAGRTQPPVTGLDDIERALGLPAGALR